MPDRTWLSRTELLIGDTGLDQLARAHVLVVGLGGVGSFAAEFVARAGVGCMTIVDGDVVDPSNRNRQLPALTSTHGQAKADIMANRLRDINPDLDLRVIQEFIRPDAVQALMNSGPFDYVMDCIDSITPKLLLLQAAYERGFPIVSSMGAGGKLDPTQICVTDLFETWSCTMAQYVRKRLRRLSVGAGIKAVFSTEPVRDESLLLTDGGSFKRSAYGTISYIPATFGSVCASVVIRDLLNEPIATVARPAFIRQKAVKTIVP
jgi:tRNA threonylcarbamoyladenosine dehydratase